QLNVAHTLTAYFGLGHFNAALLTNNTTVFQALVLTAQALVVLFIFSASIKRNDDEKSHNNLSIRANRKKS
ncbi:hypothetical protein MJM43_32630, partial [Salmonella enterica subsp. enterica serovar Montevideo]|nr:hypothetical protein [Salmonella enterica subsp. enterica serovar Montevideo]